MIGQSMALSGNKQFAEQISRLPHEIQMLLQPMFAAYDKRVSELQRDRSRDQEALQAAQAELRELQASVKEVVNENDSLRHELQEATHKLLQETTRTGGSPGASPSRGGAGGELASEARQEFETMVQLLRSENNVLLSQRRSLAEEAQALKVHRDRIEAQLKQAQDELAATRGSMQELTARLQESESDGTTCSHDLRSSQQRLSTSEHELVEVRDDLVRTREELKALREVHEESSRSLEETRARQRLDKSVSLQVSDQLERCQQELQELEEKYRVKRRELEAASQLAQNLTQTMESFEQRALEAHQKDVEAFNLREETKEMINNANLEKEAGITRESALQRQVASLSEKVRISTHEAADAFEVEKQAMHEKYSSVVNELEERLTVLTSQCAELQLRAERAEREQRSTEATLARLSDSNVAQAVNERITEATQMVSNAEQARDEALAKLDEVGGACDRAQVALSKKEADAARRESTLQNALARQERIAAASQEEAKQLSESLHAMGVTHRQLQRQLESASLKCEEETSNLRREQTIQLEDMESNHRMQLDQQRRLAHDSATQVVGAAWQQKFEIATRRFDDIVAKLTQQNTALRAQAAAAGHDVDAAMGGSAAVSSGGPASKKLSAMLAASEKRSADCLARVQTLLKREANLMEETASLHEQLDRVKVTQGRAEREAARLARELAVATAAGRS